jgi:predicted enzyme related to lactoylglutathione lyase
VINSNGKAIGGISKLAPQYGSVGEWIGSISVSDVSKAVEYNNNKGGKTLLKAMNVKGRGKTALVQDPQGAIVSFIHSESGDPAVEIDKTWLWNELWTNDLTSSMNYYKGLIPYTTEKIEQASAPYYAFQNGGKKLSGMMANPVEDMRTSWIPYIRVYNINEVVNKARAAGAYIVSEPKSDVRNGTLAIVQDPAGAKFALQVIK